MCWRLGVWLTPDAAPLVVAGFEGVHCEDDVDECEVKPCHNGGVCFNHVAKFTCHCPRGQSNAASHQVAARVCFVVQFYLPWHLGAANGIR